METREIPLQFLCNKDTLLGILHYPAIPDKRGVLVVVGGPQYRAGSHRQFVLLARYLASEGVSVLRFDYRGMGDSEGDVRSFEDLDADIEAAVDTLFAQVREVEEVVIWGLCDAASAASFYAYRDRRVVGVVLANPWVRTERGLARARIKHYYLRRLISPTLWRKVFRGEVDYLESVRSLFGAVSNLFPSKEVGVEFTIRKTGRIGQSRSDPLPLPERMAIKLGNFDGKVLLILSGRDLTADEFKNTAMESRRWAKILQSSRVVRRDFPRIDHTFSRRGWRDQIAATTLEWLRSW